MAYDHLPSMQGCTVQERLWPGAEPRAPSVCLVGLSGRQLATGIDGSFDFPGRQPWETCTSQLTSHAFSCAAFALYPLAMALSGIIIGWPAFFGKLFIHKDPDPLFDTWPQCFHHKISEFVRAESLTD